jgi:hypothetical protein
LLFINFTASNRHNNRVTYKNNEEKYQQQDQWPTAIATGCAAKLKQEYPWQAAGTDVSPPVPDPMASSCTRNTNWRTVTFSTSSLHFSSIRYSSSSVFFQANL